MPKDLISIAGQIEERITLIEKARGRLDELAAAKSAAIVEFDKALACEIVRLRDRGQPATVVEKLAKGQEKVAEARYSMEIAESAYKATVTTITALQAELNGYQSIFRHLDTGG